MDEKLFHEIAEQVEREFMCSGLTGGLYEDFAKKILVRYLAAQQRVQPTIYTCETCGENLQCVNGMCADKGQRLPQTAGRTLKMKLTKQEIEMCQTAVGIVTDTRTMTENNVAKWDMLYEKLEFMLRSLPTPCIPDVGVCTCENVDEANRGTWLVCGQCLKPRRR